MSESAFYDEVDDLLRAAGLRITPARQAIIHALVVSDDHPDTEQILARTKDARISQATTYRTLALLTERGLLRTHTFDGSATRYELASRPHHDHLIDVETGEVREFFSPEIERLQRQIASEYGYEIIAHRLELYCKKII